MPTEVYNLAAFSSVGASFGQPELVEQTNADAVGGLLRELVAHRDRHGATPRFFQASSSEMYGGNPELPFRETSALAPRSPYAAAKCTAHRLVAEFRESAGLFACSGILFNHESPLRGDRFVTRKITRGVAEIALGRRSTLTLGDQTVRRDWGAAADHVRAMQLMLAADEPADYVVATGESHSLGELLEVAFAAAGLGPPSSYVVTDPALLRPADLPETRGDATRARDDLGWQPTVGFEELVTQMVRVDLERLSTGVEESPDYLGGFSRRPAAR
jgi:GDPmannose 4,6-dehydratase